MWTVKRIMILVGGLIVCLGAFMVYALFLGIIDGFPNIPDDLLPPPIGTPPQDRRGPISSTDKKIEQAFGAGCEELRRPLRLWVPDKGVAFSAGDFSIDDKHTGRVRLAPFSAAIYHKSKNGGAYTEISTLKSDVAILTLDQGVSSHAELARRKVIAVELQGGRPGVTIGNNRGTAEKTDDIDVLVTNGSLFYEEKRNLIWTEGVVCVTDHATKLPTIVRGKHMQMYLAKDASPNRPKTSAGSQRTSGNKDAGNIEKIVVHSDVEMRFWVDARAGFLGGAPNTKDRPLVPTKPADDNNPERAQIIIKTGGMFVYDLVRETAFFESPPPREEKTLDPLYPDQVHVQRNQKVDGKDKFDQLTCDRLDLQFRQRLMPTGAAASASGSNKDIETARATARPGNDVALALDSEHIAAHGAEFTYTAGNLVDGPLMVLKGEPLLSNKNGHMMKCKELHIHGANRFGDGQKARAVGPGKIDLLDAKNPEKTEFPVHVTWRDMLTVTKVKEGSHTFDLITVTGAASFSDDHQKQELHGDKIMVWLRNRQDGARNVDAVAAHGQDLHRVFVQGNVRAASPEFTIRQANTMTTTFLAAVARNDKLPDLEEKKPAGPKKGPANVLEKKPAPEEKKPRPPIELQANDITAVVASIGTKKLHELVARGNVFVFQAGDKPGEKRIDITGQLLTVNKVSENGDLLVVHGDKKAHARLGLGEIVLSGALVTINQDKNSVEVDGAGVMEMPTNKNLDGSDTAKKNSRVNILWHKGMTFDGKNAFFTGGVQAQEVGPQGEHYPSWLLCKELQTVLTKRVSFTDGDKVGDKGESAKVERIICDKDVFIDDSKIDDKRNLVQRNVLQGRYLVNKDDGKTDVSGPGQVRLLAKGSSELGIAPPPPGVPLAPAKSEWKLTHVKFRDFMTAKAVGEVKTATFYGNHSGVEVFHFPTNDIKAAMNPDHPPKDGMYLRCEILDVAARQSLGKTGHIMIAKQNVFFRTDVYQGYADVLKYDEASDTVIFEGLNGNAVRLYRVLDNGQLQAETVRSTKVLYDRRSGKLETEGVKSISN